MSNDGRGLDDPESDDAGAKGGKEGASEEPKSGTRPSWSFGSGGRCMRSDRMGRVDITQTRMRAANSDV